MRLLPANKTTFGKVLPRRISLLKNLVSQLILHEQIVTTSGKARAIRPIVELLVKNAKSGRSDLRTEVENWTVNHDKTLQLLYGPLKSRYENREEGFTRSYNLLHRKYRHAEMSVVEFINGPRDTLKNLEKYKDELAQFKEKNGDLLSMDIDELIQGVDSHPRGKLHRHKKSEKMRANQRDQVLLEAGRLKSKYIMELFAKNASGEHMPEEHPEFWVR